MKLSGSVLVPAILAVLSGAPARGSEPKGVESADVSMQLAVRPAAVLSTQHAGRAFPVIRAPAIVVAGADETIAVPFVARYQNALDAKQVVHVGRRPKIDRKGNARLNHFIFRKTAAPAAPLVAVKR